MREPALKESMPAEPKSDFHRENAHVLLIDVAGYSKMLIDEQSEALQVLNKIVRKTEPSRVSEKTGKHTELARGNIPQARPLLENTRQYFESQVQLSREDGFRRTSLPLVYCYLGRPEDAVRKAKKAVELVPENTDAMWTRSAAIRAFRNWYAARNQRQFTNNSAV